MKQAKIILILIIGIIITLCLVFNEELNKISIKLLHRNTILAHYNNKKQLDGEYTAYLHGHVYATAFFKNGLREGMSTWFDQETYKKSRELLFKNGVTNGVENVYYKNGNLDYTDFLKNNRHYKSEFHYLDNGILNTYNAFDQRRNEDNGYCYVAYDLKGNFHQILGYVFSPTIYSMCKDSIILLMDNTKYLLIKDLYIDVSTPPQLTPVINLFINNVEVKNLVIKENTIHLKNVFDKTGAYHILIYGYMLTKAKWLLKADTLKTTIVKN